MGTLHELTKAGQSVWLDFIRRDMLTGGELDAMVQNGIRGLTSNPTIFQKAIAGSDAYDDAIRAALAANPGSSAMEIYEGLAIADIQNAASAHHQNRASAHFNQRIAVQIGDGDILHGLRNRVEDDDEIDAVFKVGDDILTEIRLAKDEPIDAVAAAVTAGGCEHHHKVATQKAGRIHFGLVPRHETVALKCKGRSLARLRP